MSVYTHQGDDAPEMQVGTADRLIAGADGIKLEIVRSNGSYEIAYEIAGSIAGGPDAMAAVRDLFYQLQAADEAESDDTPEPEPVGHHGCRCGRNGGAA